jgi:hypothetical protein
VENTAVSEKIESLRARAEAGEDAMWKTTVIDDIDPKGSTRFKMKWVAIAKEKKCAALSEIAAFPGCRCTHPTRRLQMQSSPPTTI